jgi:LPS-assembly lipoprotein
VLTEELTLLLEAGGASLVSNAEEADAVLEVGGESFSQRVLAVDPQTGKAREFQLGYVATFSFKPRTGPTVVDGEEVRIVRELLFDDEAVLGKLEERSTLYSEMRRDAAQQILLRLRVRMTP